LFQLSLSPSMSWMILSGVVGQTNNAGNENGPVYLPAARTFASAWIEPHFPPVFWMFGGMTSVGTQNDLWRWSSSDNWLPWSLPSTQFGKEPAVEQGPAVPPNNPGSRSGATAAMVVDNGLYLFGGNGYTALNVGGPGMIAQLW
jgi:hypothetical protein